MVENKKERTELDHIMEKVLSSGFPLEIEISGLLDREYSVHNSHYYTDKSANDNGRSIDIYATTNAESPFVSQNFFIYFNLSIECKKSNDYSWVFFTRPHNSEDYDSEKNISGQVRSTCPKVNSTIFGPDQNIRHYISQITHYSNFQRIAIAYDEVKKQKLSKDNERKGRNEIFEALMQIQKFTCFRAHIDTDDYDFNGDPDFIMVYMPVIVIDGDLYEAYSSAGSIELQKKEHLLLKSEFQCPYCNRIEFFTVDVVHRSYFSEFLKILTKDRLKIKEIISQKSQEIAKIAEEERDKRKPQLDNRRIN